MAEVTPSSSASRKRLAAESSVIIYAAQCGECFKWRSVESQDEFESMRSRFIEEPFICLMKAGASCDDPADLEYDTTRVWAIDKPNIPKTPAGFRRELVLRKDLTKMDAYYTSPAGKKVKCKSEVASLLKTNPDFKGLSVDDFSFVTPKVVNNSVSLNAIGNGGERAAARAGGNDVDA